MQVPLWTWLVLKVPPLLAIGLIVLCIGTSVAASLLADRREHAGKRPQEC